MPREPAKTPPSADGDLKDEIRQNLPFRSPRHEAYLSLLRTADRARYVVAKVIEAGGVTPQQYNVLRILRGAGEDGLTTGDIVDRMIERTPAITRLLDRLEAKGWVTRERPRANRRTVRCRATASALALLAAMDEPVFQVNEALFQGMDAEDVDDLIRLLAKFRAGLPR